MKDQPQLDCPRTEQLSALIDGELADAARAEIAAHATLCPLCGAMLRNLGDLRVALQPLAAASIGADLALLIDGRLAPRGPRRRPPRDVSWWHVWQLLPSGLAGIAVFAAGVYLGALLAGGASVTVMQPAAMAIFNPVPPGGLCIGLPSCYSLGR